jgi:hypothetical protein
VREWLNCTRRKQVIYHQGDFLDTDPSPKFSLGAWDLLRVRIDVENLIVAVETERDEGGQARGA